MSNSVTSLRPAPVRTQQALVTGAALVLAAGLGTHSVIVSRKLRQAQIEPLTGLFRREPWTVAAHRHLHRRPDTSAVVLIDLNEFKPVNDTYGHAAGDVVLTVQAGRMAEHFAARPATLGRFGGDEFVAVASLEEDLAANLAALAAKLAEPIALPDGPEVSVTASIGAVRYAELRRPSLADALHRADGAMYQSKHVEFGPVIADPTKPVCIEPAPRHRQRHHGPATANA